MVSGNCVPNSIHSVGVFCLFEFALSVKNYLVDDQNGFVGLAVGCCFLSGGFAGNAICNTFMNSAIAIGLGFVDARTGKFSNGVW